MTPRTPQPRQSRAARNASLRSAGLKPVREFGNVAEKAEQMAADIIEQADGMDRSCSKEDLMRLGWSAEEIARHGDTARALAHGKTRERGIVAGRA